MQLVKLILRWLICLLPWLPFIPAQAAETAQPDIYIVGALHRLHETEDAFPYSELERIITAIQPDVLVLEVRPDELAERKDTPGRPEYPKVVWPLLARMSVIATAMEPGEPLFGEIVNSASRLMSAFEKEKPADSSLLDAYDAALRTALTAHWSTAAHTHDRTTDDLMRGHYVIHNAVTGKTLAATQKRWDDYMVQQALAAARAHPGKRILVLASYKNRHLFEDAFKAAFPKRLVNMETWLRR